MDHRILNGERLEKEVLIHFKIHGFDFEESAMPSSWQKYIGKKVERLLLEAHDWTKDYSIKDVSFSESGDVPEARVRCKTGMLKETLRTKILTLTESSDLFTLQSIEDVAFVMANEGRVCSVCKFTTKENTRHCKFCAKPFDLTASLRELNLEDSDDTEWKCGRCNNLNSGAAVLCTGCFLQKKAWNCLNCWEWNIETAEICSACFSEKRTSTDSVDIDERRLVLIGKTGCGKSATGNTILGENYFISTVSGKSVTKLCKINSATRYGKKIIVVDTPGLFDTDMPADAITIEIAKCFRLTTPGPHAFLFVIRIGRFTQEEKETVKHFTQIFGENLYRYLILLFTGKDALEGRDLDSYLATVPEQLTELVAKCNRRCVDFDNTPKNVNKEADVKNLLFTIERMLAENGGSFYSNEMYKASEEILQKKIALKMKSKDDEIKKLKAHYAKKRQEDMEKIAGLEEQLHEILTSGNANKTKVIQGQITQEIQKRKDSLANSMREEEKKLEGLRNNAREEIQVEYEAGALSDLIEGLQKIASAAWKLIKGFMRGFTGRMTIRKT